MPRRAWASATMRDGRLEAGHVEAQALVLGLGCGHLGLELVDRPLALGEEDPDADDGEQSGAGQPGEGADPQPAAASGPCAVGSGGLTIRSGVRRTGWVRGWGAIRGRGRAVAAARGTRRTGGGRGGGPADPDGEVERCRGSRGPAEGRCGRGGGVASWTGGWGRGWSRRRSGASRRGRGSGALAAGRRCGGHRRSGSVAAAGRWSDRLAPDRPGPPAAPSGPRPRARGGVGAGGGGLPAGRSGAATPGVRPAALAVTRARVGAAWGVLRCCP